MKPAALVTTLVLCAIAVLHVLRLVLQVEINAGTVVIPMWASVPAVLCARARSRSGSGGNNGNNT